MLAEHMQDVGVLIDETHPLYSYKSIWIDFPEVREPLPGVVYHTSILTGFITPEPSRLPLGQCPRSVVPTGQVTVVLSNQAIIEVSLNGREFCLESFKPVQT